MSKLPPLEKDPVVLKARIKEVSIFVKNDPRDF
jgi:hypothetical protein